MNNIELGETAAWLDALYGKCTPEDGELVFIASDKRKVFKPCKLGSGDALVAAAKAVCGHRGLYLKINPIDYAAVRNRSVHGIGTKAEVKTIVSIHLDCDAGKPGYLSRAEMIAGLDLMPHKPTLVVNSGGGDGGFHAYWILKQPHRIVDDVDRDQVNQMSHRWCDRLKAICGNVDKTSNIDRVLRVVGGTRTDGKRVTCHGYWPDRLYEPVDLWIRKPYEPKPLASGLRLARNFSEDSASRYLAKMPESVDGQEGGKTCLKAAIRMMSNFDMDDEQTFAILRDEFNPRCKPVWSDRELRHKVTEARKKVGA